MDQLIERNAYVYRYDDALRQIYAKIPGVDPVTTVYDPDGLVAYTYDANRDVRYRWDSNNMISTAAFDQGVVEFTRSATGKLLQRAYAPYRHLLEVSDSIPTLKPRPFSAASLIGGSSGLRPWNPGMDFLVCDYFNHYGHYEYTNDRFSRVNTSSGYIDSLGVHIYVRDRQGNIRAVVRSENSAPVIEQATYYYPYGMPMPESTNPTANPYKYTGKELITDRGLNLYDYGARFADPTTGLWLSADPLSEVNTGISPFNMVNCDPINIIDPQGLVNLNVEGIGHKEIDDGNDDLFLNVSAREFEDLNFYFNCGSLYYHQLLDNLTVANGYVTGRRYYDSESSSGYGLSYTKHNPGGDSYYTWAEKVMFSSMYSHLTTAISTGFTIIEGIGKKKKDISIGSNGKLYFRQASKKIFQGNQYVKTWNLSRDFGKFFQYTKLAGLSWAFGIAAYDIFLGYQLDHKTFGYNTQKKIASNIGAFAGSYFIGQDWQRRGTLIGGSSGEGGAAIGGIAGHIAGSLVGGYVGSYVGESIYKHINKPK